MSKVSLNPVRLYSEGDIYVVDVDNRPLVDITNNIDTLNSTLDQLGFYHEKLANPETEPVGGFSVYDCVSVQDNGLLFPIDISAPAAVVDYSKFPIYLIVGKSLVNGVNKYKALSFSASLKLTGQVNTFLSDSIGKPLRVGPNGTLVDATYFDLYYSNYTYQILTVGTVLAADTVAFGGNQVAVVKGDNAFLGKNINDTTTGLVTVVRNAADSNIVNQGVLYNGALGVQYPFVEYKNYMLTADSTLPAPIDVYFTNASPITQASGEFTTAGSLDSYLNQVHFKSPTITAATDLAAKYKSVGVTVGSLLEYSDTSLLHSAEYSKLISEASQALGTSLIISSDTAPTVVGFKSAKGLIGTSWDSATRLPSNMTALLAGAGGGVAFDSTTPSVTTPGAVITTVVDQSLSIADDAAVVNYKTPKLSQMVGSTNLVIKSTADTAKVTEGPANILMSADGYIVLGAKSGVHYMSASYETAKNTEIATVGLLDTKIASMQADAATQQIPLVGNTSEAPITGGLYFNTANGTQSSTFMTVSTPNEPTLKVNKTLLVQTLDGQYQAVRGRTPSGTTLDPGTPNDFVTRQFLADTLAGGVNTSFLSSSSAASINAVYTFNATPVIQSALTPEITLRATAVGLGAKANIRTNAPSLNVISATTGLPVVLTAKSPVSADGPNAVVTQEKLTASLIDAQQSLQWAAWNVAALASVDSMLSTVIPGTTSSNFTSVLNVYTGATGLRYYKSYAATTCTYRVACTINLDGTNISKVLNLRKISYTGQDSIVASASFGSTPSTYNVSADAPSGLFGDIRQWYTRFISQVVPVKGSIVIDHIISLNPNEGFYFTLDNISSNGIDNSVTVFGSVEQISKGV